jgi:hypothetical protein
MNAPSNRKALAKTNQCGLPNGHRTMAPITAITADMVQQNVAAK